MAIQWGAWTSGYSNNFRVGIDLSVSGTTITARYYVEAQYVANDTQTLVRSGAITGSHNYTYNQAGGQRLIVTNTRSGSRGSTYTFGASITGIYNGARPSVSGVSITVPALPPSKPGTPSISSITSTSMKATWNAPSNNNGAPIIEYQHQRATNSGFTSGVVTYTQTGRSRTHSGLASNTTYYFRVRARNSAGWSDWSGTRSATTNPATPNAPSNVTVTRSSDTRHVVSWTRNATSAAPYASQIVQRRVNNGGNTAGWSAWSTIATVSGTATSYTDNSTVANHAYQYRVQAKNASGTSTSSASDIARTTPATPPTASATKRSDGNIRITWTIGNTFIYADTEIQHSTDGGASWSTLATVASGTTTYDHVGPSLVDTHTYRVRHVINAPGTVGHGLASSFRQTNTVQLAAPPNPPTILGPNGARDADNGIILSWQHNPVDSSEQRQYEWRWRIEGDPTWTTEPVEVTGAESHLVPGGTWSNGDTIEWAVRTWGEHADPSPWSATGIVVLSQPPSVTIDSPTDSSVWTNPQVQVDWTYFDPEGSDQSGWEIRLLNGDGLVVETKTGEGDTSSALLDTLLPDQSSWTIEVRVRDGAAMWSAWASVSFLVAYPRPVPPLVSPLWQPTTGTIEVTVTNPPPTPLVEYSWDGTPDNSTSSSTSGRVNFAPEPRVATTPVGWGGVSTAEWSVTHVTGDLGGGPVEWVDSYMRGEFVDEPPSPFEASDYGIFYLNFGFSGPLEGDTVAASVYVRSSTDTRVAAAFGMSTSEGESYITYSYVDLVAGQWTRISQQVVLEQGDATAVTVMLTYDPNADLVLSQGDTLDVTALLIESNPGEDTSYFDGERPDSGNEPEVVTNDIYRQINGGEWVLVATGIEPNGSWVDFTTPVVGTICYRAVGWSDLPSAATGPEECVLLVDGTEPCPPEADGRVMSAFIGAGEGFTNVARAYLDLRIDVAEVGLADRMLHRFSGRTYPVEFSGIGQTEVVTLSFTAPRHEVLRNGEEVSLYEHWVAIASMKGPHYYRDYKGRTWRCSLSPLRVTDNGLGTYTLSLTVTRTGGPA